MSWNPQQQAMLSAMGYTLYRPAGAEPLASVREDAQSPAPAGTSSDRLMKALSRAAGGHDLAALALPPMEQLRRSAAAKRALWPTLRALRRKL